MRHIGPVSVVLQLQLMSDWGPWIGDQCHTNGLCLWTTLLSFLPNLSLPKCTKYWCGVLWITVQRCYFSSVIHSKLHRVWVVRLFWALFI